MKISVLLPSLSIRATIVVLASISISCATNAKPIEQLDRALIQSLKNKDIGTARKHLENGANPEAILGKKLNDNAVCTALDDRSSKYFELLQEYGASANAFWPEAHVTQRTPLVCSIEMHNFQAFEYLLENGADPSVDLYPEAQEKFRNEETAITYAMGYKIYPMALRLLSEYELHSAEIKYIASALQLSPYDEKHPWNYARDALIEWTKERVPDFKPLPAHPAPEGHVPECLFYWRDRAEGLKKGTICPPSESQ